MNTRPGVMALFCLLVLSGPIWAAPPESFEVTILPDWQGKTLDPYAMNDHGQVVGFVCLPEGQCHLFLWDREDGVRDLGPVNPRPCDINNKGQIVGTIHRDSLLHAFLREPDGSMEIIGTSHCEAVAINERGQVVGRVFVPVPGVYHAFIWDRTRGLRDLGAPTGVASGATAVSETGQVFGFIEHSEGPHRKRRPAYWMAVDSDAIETKETPSREFYDMNAKGWVVGRTAPYYMPDEPILSLWHGQIDVRKNYVDFSIGKDTVVQACLVNDANQVVCVEQTKPDLFAENIDDFTPQERRWFWEPDQGSRVSLDPYLPRQTHTFELRDLNHRGDILGVAHLDHDERRIPLILQPAPGK